MEKTWRLELMSMIGMVGMIGIPPSTLQIEKDSEQV